MLSASLTAVTDEKDALAQQLTATSEQSTALEASLAETQAQLKDAQAQLTDAQSGLADTRDLLERARNESGVLSDLAVKTLLSRLSPAPEDAPTQVSRLTVTLDGETVFETDEALTDAQRAQLIAVAEEVNASQETYVINVDDHRSPVLIVNGESITKLDMENALRAARAAGMAQADDTQLIAWVAEDLTEDLVLRQKAAELGLDQLTEEEEQAALESAQRAFDAQLPGEGEPLEALLLREKRAAVDRKLREETVKNVTVTDEDLSAVLAELSADQQALFSADPDLYGISVMEGENVYYVPAGYRYVKTLLMRVDFAQVAALRKELSVAQAHLADVESRLETASRSRDQAAIRALTDEQAQAEQAVERAKGSLEATEAIVKRSAQRRPNEITQKINAPGADFDALIAEYGEDSHMPATGYAVRAGFAGLEESVVSAAMALGTVGSVADPVQTSMGYVIAQYAGDVPAGTVPLDQARESLLPGVLEQKRQNAYEAAVRAWLEEAQVEERLEILD